MYMVTGSMHACSMCFVLLGVHGPHHTFGYMNMWNLVLWPGPQSGIVHLAFSPHSHYLPPLRSSTLSDEHSIDLWLCSRGHVSNLMRHVINGSHVWLFTDVI